MKSWDLNNLRRPDGFSPEPNGLGTSQEQKSKTIIQSLVYLIYQNNRSKMNSTKFSNILVSEKVKIKHSVSVTCILMVSVIL